MKQSNVLEIIKILLPFDLRSMTEKEVTAVDLQENDNKQCQYYWR